MEVHHIGDQTFHAKDWTRTTSIKTFFFTRLFCAFALRLKYWCSVKLPRGVIKILFGRLISWSWFYRSGRRAIICICKPFHILPIWGEKKNGCSASIIAVPQSKALKQTVFSRTEGCTSVLRTKIASYIVTS